MIAENICNIYKDLYYLKNVCKGINKTQATKSQAKKRGKECLQKRFIDQITYKTGSVYQNVK